MTNKIEKEGQASQLMITMDELFREKQGVTYEEIIETFYRRKIDPSLVGFSKLSYKKQQQLLREARKAKTYLSKRLAKKGLCIQEEKEYLDPTDRRSYRKVFRYPEAIGNYDPIEDLRYKIKRLKLSELSGIMEQSVGLFPKSWLLNFSTQIDEFNRDVDKNDRISKILFFDSNEDLRNLHLLPTLVSMIREKRVIRFRYRPYEKKEYNVTAHPQILKEYNQRWFLFALTPDKNGNLRDQQFALDRIGLNITTCDNMPYMRSDTDYSQYFSERVGVSNPMADSIEVEFKVDDDKTLEYIRTKPIHRSQDINRDIVRLQLKANYEFETKLFEFADRITILKPVELRSKIANRASEILMRNKR